MQAAGGLKQLSSSDYPYYWSGGKRPKCSPGSIWFYPDLLHCSMKVFFPRCIDLFALSSGASDAMLNSLYFCRDITVVIAQQWESWKWGGERNRAWQGTKVSGHIQSHGSMHFFFDSVNCMCSHFNTMLSIDLWSIQRNNSKGRALSFFFRRSTRNYVLSTIKYLLIISGSMHQVQAKVTGVFVFLEITCYHFSIWCFFFYHDNWRKFLLLGAFILH